MKVNRKTLNYIGEGTTAATKLLEDPAKLREAMSYLERSTHELETLGKSADLLSVSKIKTIVGYTDTLQAYLSNHLDKNEVPKDLIEDTLSVLGRLNTIDMMLEYYLVKYRSGEITPRGSKKASSL
jgi:hypothetical protein